MAEPRSGPSPDDDVESLRRAGLSVWGGKIEARIERAEAMLEDAAKVENRDEVTGATAALRECVRWARSVTKSEGADATAAGYPQVVSDLEQATATVAQFLAEPEDGQR